MLIYILVFAWILLLSVLHRNNGAKPKPLNFALVMLCLALFVGLGDMLGGYDRYIYGEVFDYMSKTFHDYGIISLPIFNRYFGVEMGYGAWNLLIGLVTGNRYLFILITTLVTYALYARTIYRYSSSPYLTLVIFMGLTFFFTFTYL
ncbi:MAG: EpsG family protein, partial [Bacteroidaceae bacterium]|nr:EpsG family protein [Bacteroidaceae bacterium]